MSKKRAVPDHYTQRAKKEGYPARSVYKLQEIHEKFSILNLKKPVLDIGAAPGSWSIYVSRLTGPSGLVVSVDLQDLGSLTGPKSGGRIVPVQGDAFSQVIFSQLRELGPYGTVISDAAPATTGNRTVDTGRSFSLAQSVLYLGSELLLVGGNMVIKLFQGGGEVELRKEAGTFFEEVKMFKPKACRKDSFETFLIGLGRRETIPQVPTA